VGAEEVGGVAARLDVGDAAIEACAVGGAHALLVAVLGAEVAKAGAPVRSRLRAGDFEVTLLMWDMHRNARPEQFPARRVVVASEFTNVPQGKRHWWLVSDGAAADLCRPSRASRSTSCWSPACAP
jgi:hypothetical protein